MSTDKPKSQPDHCTKNARNIVPPFLKILANDIEKWAKEKIEARTRFAVLLRFLIHSTTDDIQTIDFPGNDDGQRKGWDGFIESHLGSPWVPKGVSGWEFGVNENINNKADKDYAKSICSVENAAKRHNMTFVFVTPRRWTKKINGLLIKKLKINGKMLGLMMQVILSNGWSNPFQHRYGLQMKQTCLHMVLKH